jgi:Zn-dependent protease with chaperone function
MSEMTATRMRHPLRLATIAVLAGVWAVAAYLLWASTKVPGGLTLGGLAERDFYTAHLVHRAAHYESFFYWLVLGQTAVTIVVFALFAWRGAGFARESAAGPIGTGMLLAMLGFGLVWLVTIPFDVLGLWWERRYHQSHESYGAVIFSGWLLLGFEFLLLCVAVLIAMGLAKLLPRFWWIPAACVFVALQVLLVFTTPYLVPDTHRIDNPRLKAAAERIARHEGVGDVPIRVQKVDTKDPNAFTSGLGPSRKVFILSSMLDGRFTEPQLELVVAHEYGHQARNHLIKGVAWYALFVFPLAYLIAVVARRRGGMSVPAAIPLVLLVYVVFGLATLPLKSAISRHMEAEADWMALQTTRNPAGMQALWQRFATTGLGDPSPPTAPYLVFYDHPSFMARIAMARAWATTKEGRTLPVPPPAGS